MNWAEWAQRIMLAVALVGLVIASILDIKTRKIPNWLTVTMAGLGLIGSILFFPYTLISKIGISLLFVVFGCLQLIGSGDAKLMIGLALLTNLAIVCLSVVIGGILLILIQLIFHSRRTKTALMNGYFSIISKNYKNLQNGTQGMPFAPYLCAGYVAAALLSLLF